MSARYAIKAPSAANLLTLGLTSLRRYQEIDQRLFIHWFHRIQLAHVWEDESSAKDAAYFLVRYLKWNFLRSIFKFIFGSWHSTGSVNEQLAVGLYLTVFKGAWILVLTWSLVRSMILRSLGFSEFQVPPQLLHLTPFSIRPSHSGSLGFLLCFIFSLDYLKLRTQIPRHQ